MDKVRIGDTIREIRIAKKINQKELSELAGVQNATLNRIENNKAIGKVETHLKIAKALGINLGVLYKNLTITKKDKNDQKHDLRCDLEGKGRVSNKLVPLLYEIPQNDKIMLEQANKGFEGFIYNMEGFVEVFIGNKSIKKRSLNKIFQLLIGFDAIG